MDAVYVDTSCLVAILFDEPGGKAAAARLSRFDEVLSSNLLEAELMAVCAREQVTFPEDVRAMVGWVLPDRPLTDEMRVVLEAGYVRGADLWHLASALFLAGDAAAITFLTLDERQKSVAAAVGFVT